MAGSSWKSRREGGNLQARHGIFRAAAGRERAMLNQKMLRQMQSRLQKVEEDLAVLQVEASAGGGAVKVVADGQQKVLSIAVDPAVLEAGDVEMLQDLLVVAVNDALAQAREAATKRMAGLTGNLKIPGLG